MKSRTLFAMFLVVFAWHWVEAQPIITVEPTNTSVSLGATARFTVTPIPTSPPITYEWWFKDAKVNVAADPSAATRQLSLTNMTLAEDGPYFVIATDQSGSATSRVATLTVDPTFTRITGGPLVNDDLDDLGIGAWGDYDNDGRLDVLTIGRANQWRLYHNDGTAQFSVVTNGVMSQRSQGMVGVWGDPDNDGDLDFYAGPTFSASESPAMYWNDGQGNFVRQPVGPAWTSNQIPLRGVLLGWGDFDRDGFLDAFLGAGFAGTSGTTITNALLHNNGDGTFAVVTNSVVNIGNDAVNNLCVEDYDSDGALDLVVVRTEGGLATRFYHNDGRGVFAEATPEPIRSEVTYAIYLAWADFDNDGDLDVIFGGCNVANGLDRDHFYINNGDGTFSRWAGQPSSFDGPLPAGWAVPETWGDFDNDGYLDLFSAAPTPRLWRNQGNATFEDVYCGSPVTDSSHYANHACWVDVNNDGFLDLFVGNLGGSGNYLYLNNRNTNHWLEVKLRGTVSDRLAVGAKIFATATIRGTTIRQLRVITAYVPNQSLASHFGLGDATNVTTLRIEWPSGIVQELSNVAADQHLTMVESQGHYPGPKPAISVANSTPGGLQLNIQEPETGWRYALEASTDLANWAMILSRTSTGGTQSFTDTKMTNYPTRFYRVIVP